MKTTDTMTPEGRRLMEEIHKLAGLEVRIGFQHGKVFYESDEDDGDEKEKVDLADIAMWNELGTSRAPSRPFLRQTADTKESEIVAFLQKAARPLLSGSGTAQSVLQEIGPYAKGLVQEQITDGEYVPNAPSTVLRKMKDGKEPVKPLIDTGLMRESVDFVIVKKGAE